MRTPGAGDVMAAENLSFDVEPGRVTGFLGPNGAGKSTLLADPGVLLFDEPINGLDLDGVRWIRGLLRQLADEGRTVLVSSHLMSEMQQTADRLVVIGRGRLIADATTRDILRGLGHLHVRVRSPRADALLSPLRERGLTVQRVAADELEVSGSTAEDVGALAHALGIPLHHLSEVERSLERAYLELTAVSVEHHGRPADYAVAEAA